MATTCPTCGGPLIDCPCEGWSCWYRRNRQPMCLTCDVAPPARTGGERYFVERMKDPAYAEAYRGAKNGSTETTND